MKKQGDIREFVEPITPRRATPKRSHLQTSPLAIEVINKKPNLEMAQNLKIGDMSHEQFVECMGDLLDKKLAHLATKVEVEELKEKIDNLEKENLTLKTSLNKLEDLNKSTMKQIQDLENRARKNNLIFTGISHRRSNCEEVVKNFCKNVLQVEEEMLIYRANPLKKEDNAPIIVNLPRDSDISSILSKTKNLKGTKFGVQRDFSFEIRKIRNKLIKIKKEIINKKRNSKIFLTYDKLIIQDVKFTWDPKKKFVTEKMTDGVEEVKKLLRIDLGETVEFLAKQEEREYKDLNEERNNPDAAENFEHVQDITKHDL